MFWPEAIERKSNRVIEQFKQNDAKLVTAESCTGGLIAAALTEISGSSAVVERGFVTYSNEAKMELVWVDRSLLERHGAVSKEVAEEMARGALSHSRAQVSVAVTGVAGPTGGSIEKPVGLVHFAAFTRSGTLLHKERRFGDIGRLNVRLATVETALDLLSEALQDL